MKAYKLMAILCIMLLAITIIAGCAKRTISDDETSGDEFDELLTGVDEIDEEESEDTVTDDDTDYEETDEEETSGTVSSRAGRTETSVSEPSTIKKITVKEGELVSLDVRGADPDGDTLVYTFSKPLNSQGRWQTKRGDAGLYQADVSVSDGKTLITKAVAIEVLKSNEPPVMENLADVSIEEGDMVTLDPQVTDPDGDKVMVTYNGWMTSSTKTTGYDDAGSYVVTITATDSEYEVSQDIHVTVQDVNRAPSFDIVLQ